MSSVFAVVKALVTVHRDAQRDLTDNEAALADAGFVPATTPGV